MGPRVQICCLVVVLIGAVVARPSADISARDAKGQTITDASDPKKKPQLMDLIKLRKAYERSEKPHSVDLSEAYKGGVVPVALMYDNPDAGEVLRTLRETTDDENHKEKEEETTDVNKYDLTSDKDEPKVTKDVVPVAEVKDKRHGIKNSKLLDIEARENDENAKFGLGIQSRNKAPVDEDTEKLEKPFVYNIQPLSFYSSETKEEENILNYINKIKEMRENQIRFEAENKKNESAKKKHEDAIVTEADSDLDNRPIRRKIQHYETLIKPMAIDPQMYGGMMDTGYPQFPASTYGMYQQPVHPQYFQQHPYSHMYQQSTYPQHQPSTYPQAYHQRFGPGSNHNPQFSSVIYLPNIFNNKDSTKVDTKSGNTRILDDYFPILVNNPFNEIWAGITNIIEYGPAADVCRKNKKGREADDDNATELDLSSQRIGFGGSKGENWPRVTRLKVRKGGVAIAGPGGIATAGSGGTAIVGPGGTAYTTKEGTAVVGPGGRVVHVPQFPIYAKNVDESKPRDFVSPPGSQTVAEGPVVYYDNPLDTGDILDPSFPF